MATEARFVPATTELTVQLEYRRSATSATQATISVTRVLPGTTTRQYLTAHVFQTDETLRYDVAAIYEREWDTEVTSTSGTATRTEKFRSVDGERTLLATFQQINA